MDELNLEVFMKICDVKVGWFVAYCMVSFLLNKWLFAVAAHVAKTSPNEAPVIVMALVVTMVVISTCLYGFVQWLSKD